MKKIVLTFAVLFSGLLSAQQQTLFSIDQEQITVDEFKAVYLKNRDIGKDIDPKTPREYLDLYINFKLKVREARDKGLDTIPSFQREFKNYRKQLAQPYLEDRSVDSSLLAEAYSRLQQEVRAAHIMIDLSPSALPEDTLAAYNKIMNIRQQIIKGAPFETTAKKFSTDPGSKDNGGDLGYFTVFDMVYPFECAAYNTPVGEVSMPVRSQYGYHIVKTLDKRKSSGSVQVKHIFLISNDKTEQEKADAAAQRIQEIYVRLQAGEDFDQLARQFSDDKNTAEDGGLLKPFGINQMMREFEEESFALQNVGDFSEPFKTQIGWHIVKLVDKKGVPTFEEVKNGLEQQISKDTRSAKSRQVFLANLKKDYNFTENTKRLKEIYKVVDESYLSGTWDPTRAAKLKKTLFTLDGVNYSQQDFVAHLDASQKRGSRGGTNVEQEVYKQYTAFVNKTIMTYEDGKLEEKYPEFKMLVNEYRDGILLFDLTQEKVWNKASKDSVGLYNYFEGNQNKYTWPDRVSANVYSCSTEKIAKKVVKMIKKPVSLEEVEQKFNLESQLVVVADSGKYAKGDHQAVDRASWENGAVSTVVVDDRYIVVQTKEFLPSQPKRLDEARGLAISDYQKMLETQWIAELKENYTVTINEEVFRSLESELN